MLSLPKILWRFHDTHVYLTFDDGPDERITPSLLDQLEKWDISATFFVIGEKAKASQNLLKRMRDMGHSIGNHTFSHQNLLGKSQKAIHSEVSLTDEIIEEVTGEKTHLFRPPYGRFGKNLLSVLNGTRHQLVLWSASTKDYKLHMKPTSLAEKIFKAAKPGNIVLLHDGHQNSQTTLEVLTGSLRKLTENGVRFAALPNHAHAQRGRPQAAGEPNTIITAREIASPHDGGNKTFI